MNESKGVGVELSLRDARQGLEILRDEFSRHVKYKMGASNYIIFKKERDADDFLARMQEEDIEVHAANPENY